MATAQKKREHLAGWLWAMYERSCHESARLTSLALPKEAEHYQRQARTIGSLLAGMTKREHPVTR